jgi:hypothetical protein
VGAPACCEGVKQKDRYDEHGKPDPHGRYDKSGNYVYTVEERMGALAIAGTLIVTAPLVKRVLDHLPYSGVIEWILGVVVLFALWTAVVGRSHPDPD